MKHILESLEEARRLIDEMNRPEIQLKSDEFSFLSFQLEAALRKAHGAALRHDRKLRGEREPLLG